MCTHVVVLTAIAEISRACTGRRNSAIPSNLIPSSVNSSLSIPVCNNKKQHLHAVYYTPKSVQNLTTKFGPIAAFVIRSVKRDLVAVPI